MDMRGGGIGAVKGMELRVGQLNCEYPPSMQKRIIYL